MLCWHVLDWPADIERNPSGPVTLYVVLFLGFLGLAHACEFVREILHFPC